MKNAKVPTKQDLHAYRVQICFLRQVRDAHQDNNEEIERSIDLLKELKDMVEEQHCAIQDLASSLDDYEEEAERILHPNIKPVPEDVGTTIPVCPHCHADIGPMRSDK